MTITYSSVKNLKFPSKNTDIINMTVKFSHLSEEVPFTAYKYDTEAHGKELWQRASQGDFGPIEEYVPPPPPTYDQLAAEIRQERDARLIKTDWTQLPDIPQVTKELWQPYRQSLRDITLQEEFPFNVIWPIPPN